MTAEIISVGTELLLGNIVNTNAAYIAVQCAKLGLSMFHQSVVGDNDGRLKEALELAAGRSDVIFLGGGLGPTEDDMTKETCAQFLGLKLIEDLHTREKIQDFFTRIGRPATDNNWKQALVPEGAIVLDNANGSAPGLVIEENGRTWILLPGPPGEMIPMFENQVVPYLKEKQTEAIYSKTLKVCGIGESPLEASIRDLIHKYENPTIATYCKVGEVHIRVTAKAKTEADAKSMVKPVVRELKERLGVAIFTTEEHQEMEDVIAQLLLSMKLSMTTAESCTGGLIAGRIVNVPGVSGCFREGYVTYSNKAKRKLLGVRKSTLLKYGAVSEKTAKEMAKGAMARSGADIAVAVTGIAGPDGGTDEKPVGLVYIACMTKTGVKVRECHFTGNRAKVREATVMAALTLVRECILEQVKL